MDGPDRKRAVWSVFVKLTMQQRAPKEGENGITSGFRAHYKLQMEVQIVVYATFTLPKNLLRESTLKLDDMVVSPNDNSVRQPLTLHALHHHNQPTRPHARQPTKPYKF